MYSICNSYCVYPIHPYLIKNWKVPNDVQKKRFDSVMNFGRVAIENATLCKDPLIAFGNSRLPMYRERE